MTEESYQRGRKVMQVANNHRSMIAKAKGNVAKWTKMEMWHRERFNEGQANGAKKALERALVTLDERRKKFAALRFPEDNLKAEKKEVRECVYCGSPTTNGNICLHCESRKTVRLYR